MIQKNTIHNIFYIGSWIYKTTLHKNLFTYNTCWQESEQLVLSQIEEGSTIVVQ